MHTPVMAGPLRVFIAEDNDDLRAAVTIFVDEAEDLSCVGGTPSLDEVAKLVRDTAAQVVVLDVELQGRSSLLELPKLRRDLGEARIVMYSGHSHPEMKRQALAAGASAYVLKSGDFDDLLTAIRNSGAQ